MPPVLGREPCVPRPLDISERLFDHARVARAFIELPDGWGPSRVVLVAWRTAGYDVQQLVRSAGPDLLIFNDVRPLGPLSGRAGAVPARCLLGQARGGDEVDEQVSVAVLVRDAAAAGPRADGPVRPVDDESHVTYGAHARESHVFTP